MASFVYKRYNLTHPIVARRSLLKERVSADERAALVWEPQRDLLQELEDSKVKSITLFASCKYVVKDTPGWRLFLYVILPDKRVVYLGAVFSKLAEDAYRQKTHDYLTHVNPTEAKRQLVLPSYQIVRDQSYLRVPLPSEDVSESSLCDAASKFLYTLRFERLSSLAYSWLSKRVSDDLEQYIKKQAVLTARHIPQQERLRIRREDLPPLES